MGGSRISSDDDTVASGKADCGGRCFMIESSTGTLCPSSVTCKRILKVGILCYLEDVSSYTPFSTPQVVTQKGLTRVYEFTQSRTHLTLDHGFRTVAIDSIALLSADQREM